MRSFLKVCQSYLSIFNLSIYLSVYHPPTCPNEKKNVQEDGEKRYKKAGSGRAPFFFLFYEHQFSSMNHILGKKYASFQLIDMLPGQAVSNELLLGLVKCPKHS